MKGKTAGKGRASRRSSSQTGDDDASVAKGERGSVHEQPNVCPKMLLQVGNELSGLKSGGEMTPQARVFVHDCKLAGCPLYTDDESLSDS